MMETEKLLLNALEQLQEAHSATVQVLTARMDKLERLIAQLASNQSAQGQLLQNLQNDRQALERLSQDLANMLGDLKRW